MTQLATRRSCGRRSTRTKPPRAAIAASDQASSHLAISRALWLQLVAELTEAIDDHTDDVVVTH